LLRNTFLHIPGVGRTTERALWEAGCTDWDALLEGLDRYSLGTAPKETARRVIERSKAHLAAGEHQFFAKALGLAEAWRAFHEFRNDCVFLDIETNGGMDGDAVTMVGLYDGVEFRALVKDEDLGEFPDVISRYSMIVTFYGSGFDLPMLQRKFWGMKFDQIHIDLCPTLKRVGIRGGLKRIERQLGIARGEDTDGLSGWDAVQLWRQYRQGDDSALERLIAYNRDDVVNLERLAEIAYARLRQVTLPEAAVL
jgi:uncharacterized protein YprB with RNaseH-like and TPR domain